MTGPGLVTVELARTLPCASIHARPPVKSCPFLFVTRRKYSRIPVVSRLTTTGAWDIESSVPISPRKMESKMVAATTAFARASLRSVLCASWYCRQARAPQTAAKSRRAASASSGSQRRNDADSTSSARAVLLSGMSNFGIAIPREKATSPGVCGVELPPSPTLAPFICASQALLRESGARTFALENRERGSTSGRLVSRPAGGGG